MVETLALSLLIAFLTQLVARIAVSRLEMRGLTNCFFARSAKREGSRDRFFACVCTFYYEPCDLVRSIALGMDISELAFKSWRNSLTSLKRAVFCFHMSGFESSTEHCFFRTFRVFSFFGTFRAHPISTSEGSFCVRLLVVVGEGMRVRS